MTAAHALNIGPTGVSFLLRVLRRLFYLARGSDLNT